MNSFLVKELSVLNWLRAISEDKLVYFPQKEGKKSYRWLPIKKKSELSFKGQVPSIVPPGKKLNPVKEELFRFEIVDGKVKATTVAVAAEQVIAGIRPCDLRAIRLMDKVYNEAQDPLYMARREKTTLILYRCNESCDESCFCESSGSLKETAGADIILTPVKDEILVQVITKNGQALMGKADFATCNSAEAKIKEYENSIPKPFGRQFSADISKFPTLMKGAWDSDAWYKHTEKCFGCGTCTLVCPTCYCFSVKDDINLDCVTGDRTRKSDSCMLPEFAEVAGEHNFRGQNEARQRHRVNRKMNYLADRFHEGLYCVGCGRCGRQCTTDIDIFNITEDIIAEGR